MTQHLNTIFTIFLVLTFCSSYGQMKTLKLQAEKIISELKRNDDYPMDGKDTLIDLNRDNFKDILIEFYGSAGTGLKNRISVYLYDTTKKSFTECEQLNILANPTFYFDKKIVVGYYIANGGGYATKLKWNGLKLDTLEYIDFDISWQGNNMTCKRTVHNYVTKKEAIKIFSSINLPKEYNYWNYKSLIKTNSR